MGAGDSSDDRMNEAYGSVLFFLAMPFALLGFVIGGIHGLRKAFARNAAHQQKWNLPAKS
jgi:hypothetical protein